MGLLIFFGINLVISLLIVTKFTNLLGVAVSSLLSAIGFQVVVAMQLGYLEPFALVAFAITFFVGLIIPTLVRYIFLKHIKKHT